jgi:hypothetical protein
MESKMIESYADLYALVEATTDEYNQNNADILSYQVNDNATCEVGNKQTRSKFVFMFARFGDEYKVGFAFYQPDELGGIRDPEWIEDVFNDEFDATFMKTLINEHLVISTD